MRLLLNIWALGVRMKMGKLMRVMEDRSLDLDQDRSMTMTLRTTVKEGMMMMKRMNIRDQNTTERTSRPTSNLAPMRLR